MFILFLSAETIGNITTNFRLGFGSFVDKRVAPYVSTRTDRLLINQINQQYKNVVM